MKDAALLQLAKRRARQLKIDASEVLDAETLGAYHYAPLSLVEYCLHEAAHLLTLGFRPEQFKAFVATFCQADLQTTLGTWFDRLSKEAADALEIDASIVTFQAGVKLGLWSDYDAILDSCVKNLSRIGTSEVRATVREAFDTSANKSPYWRHADALARWFEGNSRIFHG